MPHRHTIVPAALKLADSIRQTLSNGGDVAPLIAGSEHAAFLKTLKGVLVYTNRAYDALFSQGKPAAGRHGKDFLEESVAKVSHSSDELLIAGCQHIEFTHPCQNAAGYSALLRTAKVSLMDLALPNMSILGISVMVNRLHKSSVIRHESLVRAFAIIQSLDELEQEVVARIGRGNSTSEISEILGLTRRQLDYKRNHIYKLLRISNNVQLGHLLCRLQDAGFTDFGI